MIQKLLKNEPIQILIRPDGKEHGRDLLEVAQEYQREIGICMSCLDPENAGILRLPYGEPLMEHPYFTYQFLMFVKGCVSEHINDQVKKAGHV